MTTSDRGTSTSVRQRLVRDLPKSENYRYVYDEEFMNTYISTQIRVLREQRGMTQDQLAKAAGTGQSKVSAMESDYGSWSVRTLRKLARAFGVRLFVSFEGWGELLPRVEGFRRETLQRPKITDDPAFKAEAPSSSSSTCRDGSAACKVADCGTNRTVNKMGS